MDYGVLTDLPVKIDENETLSKVKCSAENAEQVREYARQALSDSTWRAYEYDINHFVEWGGTIPASPDLVASYLAEFGDKLAVSTLIRRLAAISKAHEMQDHASPTQADIVTLTLRGIKRQQSVQQRQASPLLRDDLISLVNLMHDDNKSQRDKAILLTGFSAALRRSEIVALNIEDVEFVTEGMVIYLRKSKTDQTGEGRKIGIPAAKSQGRICPVQVMRDWITRLGQATGPLFRSIRKGDHIKQDRLSDWAVATVIKERVTMLGLDPANYSGHSLRAGFCTSAAMMDVPEWRIMRQSGHKSYQTMMRYIRDARLFEDHPLDGMF